ncbi:MAG: hypothetical protein HQK53_18550, partial [Oligoflexia bacterium]|nr:hypothetical protein [Oligoflexia bacterium]
MIGKLHIEKALKIAIDHRFLFANIVHDGGGRMVYGESDDLPGLLVDKYSDLVLVQITTAGIDRYRDFITQEIQKYFPGSLVRIIDDSGEREKENLPNWNDKNSCYDFISDKIKLSENGLSLEVPVKHFQK